MSLKIPALMFGAILAVSASAQQQRVQQLVGKAMPSFSMKDTAGKAFTSASLKGKVVLLDFWATWCGPCKIASPTMQQLHAKYAKQGLVVIGANITDTPAAIKKYATERKYTYNFTHGNDAFSNKIGVQGIPAFVFIDRKGVVRRVETGFAPGHSEASFEQTVKQLLAAK